MTTDFPGNSKTPRPQTPEKPEKNIESVVTNKVETRKKPLMKRFMDVFIGGDSRSVLQYVITDVLVPQAKDMITEAASQGFERLIYGESRPSGRYRGRGPSSSGPVQYNRYAVRGNNPIGRAGDPDRRSMASPRTQHVEDILLATRIEGDTVLERMYDLLREYETVSVADLNSLVDRSSSYVDQKWGWTDLEGSTVRRVRDGYILDLPKVVPLD